LLLPLTWWGVLPWTDTDGLWEKVLSGVIHYLSLLGLFLVSLSVYDKPVAWGIGAGIVLGIAAAAMGLGYFFLESETGDEVKNVIRERKNGFKEKYCPRIEWE
jgi:hypothetical protein